MYLFLIGIIIGIAKVVPGVSGAMIAISFSVYERLINSVTNFFDDKKNNLRFLLIIGSGILVSIVFFSKIIRYFIGNYYLITMMFFIGLIVGGTYKFSKNIKYNFKNIIIIFIVVIIMLFIGLFNVSNNYIMQGNYVDYIMFFIGGIIEVITSLVPGISGTALYMLMGMYDNVLMLFSHIFNISFVVNNLLIYVCYGMGMMISFVLSTLGISYLLKKYRKLFDTIVLGFSISSILLLVIMTFSNGFIFVDLIIGLILFFIGVIISYLFSI